MFTTSLHLLHVKVFRIAAEYAECDWAYPYFLHSKAYKAGSIVMRAACERLVELTELNMPLNLERFFRWNHMQCYLMLMLAVEIGEHVVSAGYHFEVRTVAVPRHVDIPAVVGVLNEGKGVFTASACEDAFYEVMNRAEVVDKVCHILYIEDLFP